MGPLSPVSPLSYSINFELDYFGFFLLPFLPFTHWSLQVKENSITVEKWDCVHCAKRSNRKQYLTKPQRLSERRKENHSYFMKRLRDNLLKIYGSVPLIDVCQMVRRDWFYEPGLK